MTEHIFITLLAGTQNNQLNTVLAQLVHNIGDQVKALLVGKP
jgi:hypothetical protein